MTDRTPIDEDIHAPLLERLGRIVYRWAYVEWLEGEFFAHLLRGDKGRTHIVTKDISAATITGWLRILCDTEFAHPETKANLNDLFNRITAVRAERNAYIHGLWTAGSQMGTADVMTLRWGRAEIMKNEVVTQGDLDSLLEEIECLYRSLTSFSQQLGFGLGAPDKAR
jgi:hypothetical protein